MSFIGWLDQVHGIHRRDRIAIEVHPELVLKNAKIGNAGTILGLKKKQNIAYCLVHLNKKKHDSPAGVVTASVLRGGNRKLYVNDIKTHTGFLIDTGSDVSCYPKSFLTKEIKKTDFVLYAANGTRIATFGTKLLSLDLGLRRTLQWPFIVADVTKPIIGADFLQHFGLLIDLKKRCFIDPLTNFTVRGKSTVSDIPVVKTIVGNSEYSELLRKFKEITQLNSSPKDTIKHDTVHYIPTIGPPISARAHRLNPAQLKIAKQEFEYMLEKGICRPSKSNWASPLHIVPKGASDWRPKGDYRAVNRITIPDKYPIPHIQDCMYMLNGKKVFSKIDLVRAYHQIPVHPPDIPKTAVITQFGLFVFPFLNFSLCSAAQTFQRFIKEILRGLDYCFPYLDDILIASENQVEHKRHLEEIFTRFRKYGIIINQSKCKFGKDTIDFLGHTINSNGCTPHRDKVRAILEYNKPVTISDLRRFLGMVNYYHRLIPNIATILSPLNQLLVGAKKHDKREIQWNIETEKSFQDIRDAMAKATLLYHPSVDAKLALVTDCSDFAMGGVLQEISSDGPKPLGFFSKKLSPTQCKYSTYDRELLAAYSAIQQFRHLLEVRIFTLYIDHKPIIFAFKQKQEKATPRRLRQLDFISQFTTDIKYLPGKGNVVADTLSRICEIQFSSLSDLELWANLQETDEELRSILEGNAKFSGNLVKVQMPDIARSLYADNSTRINRFYVPLQLRRRVFDELHSLSHPGIRGTKQLVSSKYIWPDMNKDIGIWCRACINCQWSKVQLHTKTPLVQFLISDERFAHVHLDIIKLPLVRGYKYCLTMIDRFTRWPEAAPMSDMEAETVARAFVNTWISRFRTPQRLTCDRGGQFESGLFETLSKLLGVHLT
ncbi:Transposon Ty3-G Gag-Pol polyprotein [Araneus ventricosus]|uniref:RNA-directed DNA polymerase n=1 Tax=Araneus ventricosus TaxID=182803 RepID=A0A4Y2V330_ARAVE|nr:Transposon Ty3-G Gag-Pol polyprotein [Araneus ventricosus]